MRRRRDLPSLDLLKGFESAARHLSFTKAAAELFLTQSAISRQVKALEDQLGVLLFRRENRALFLTDAGQLLLHAAGEMMDLLDDTLDRLWWERVASLLRERDSGQGRENATRELTQMGYERHDAPPPPISNEQAMRELRRQRDPRFYAAWKARVLQHVRRDRTLPWSDGM